ncbi:hypothetical protein LPJ69_004792 [Coemansia sp. RSA 1752]|nr:hypothetical protein LPJ69_004792 [Coemansia sp. RSA 1752]
MDADEEFRLQVSAVANHKDSTYYRTAELDAHVIDASLTGLSATIELTIGENEICNAECLDEGLVSTIADFWTSTLITAANGGKGAVTTTLSVQALKPIYSGTKIHVICTASEPESRPMPYATARFVNAANHNDIFALATHTKFFKRA